MYFFGKMLPRCAQMKPPPNHLVQSRMLFKNCYLLQKCQKGVSGKVFWEIVFLKETTPWPGMFCQRSNLSPFACQKSLIGGWKKLKVCITHFDIFVSILAVYGAVNSSFRSLQSQTTTNVGPSNSMFCCITTGELQVWHLFNWLIVWFLLVSLGFSKRGNQSIKTISASLFFYCNVFKP